MPKTVLFLHDTSLATTRGAELTIKELMAFGEAKGYAVQLDYLKQFEDTKTRILQADLVIVNSTSRCKFEMDLLHYLVLEPINYIKVEYDYNFCIRRNILCTVDRSIKSCCHPDKFHLYRKLFQGAKMNVFQSPKHYNAHKEFYGKAIQKHLIMPPTVDVKNLDPKTERLEDNIPFFGDLNYLKGGDDLVAYAKANPKIKFTVYGSNLLRRELPENISFLEPVNNKEVLQILGQTKTIFCKPVWPEPSGRLAAEAFLSGCELIANDRIGTFSFDFYPDNPKEAIREIEQAPEKFWEAVANAVLAKKESPEPKLGKVLVYKSYGGLGDIFFAIPAIYKLAKVSQELHFAVAPRLVEFFTKHLIGVQVVNEALVREQEDNYDSVYELGNYPAFRGYDLPHALRYPTHKKVKQHAISHYIDTIAKLHKDIDNQLQGYPYFEYNRNFEQPYFVVHHGAGFLLKIWPTEKYAALIEKLHELYPNLACKVIQGPDDPDLASHFSKPFEHISYVTGGMTEVGEAIAGALFHIGNDAGITHVAGSFNVPSVGIYGPTGPGSWGSFAEFNELIWGKKGVCNLKCNYDVILNCDHRVCLTSVTIDRVLGALYKLLQRAYPKQPNRILVNPLANVELNKNDCLVKIGDRDFLIEYHSDAMKTQFEKLLNEQEIALDNDLKLVAQVLQKQEILFQVPRF